MSNANHLFSRTRHPSGSRTSATRSRGRPSSAAWIEGFLAGDPSLLLHDHTLLRIVDDWVSDVRPSTFDELLPVLRRSFATFAAPDRRALGTHLRQLEHGGGPTTADETLDRERAERVLPRLRELLGARP